MADGESDLKFEGVGGTTQVTQFITFIRRKALAASRSRDKEWIADFAATHLDGEAFLWHLNLDQAVQTDWDKLQRALVERYSTQADAQSAKTVAEAPAVAPPPPTASVLGSGFLKGCIRVEAPGETGYLSRILDREFNVFVFGTSVSDAIRVRFQPNGFVHEISLLEYQAPFQCLGIIRTDTYKFGPGSHLHANLIPVTASGVNPVRTVKTGLNGSASNLVWCYSPADQRIRGIYTEGPCTYVLSVIRNKWNKRVLLVSDVGEVSRRAPSYYHYEEVSLYFVPS